MGSGVGIRDGGGWNVLPAAAVRLRAGAPYGPAAAPCAGRLGIPPVAQPDLAGIGRVGGRPGAGHAEEPAAVEAAPDARRFPRSGRGAPLLWSARLCRNVARRRRFADRAADLLFAG